MREEEHGNEKRGEWKRNGRVSDGQDGKESKGGRRGKRGWGGGSREQGGKKAGVAGGG